MNSTLNGPRRPPAAGGAATSLVVLLHGLGADGADLIELAGPLAAKLPHAAFVAPDAPEPCDMAPYGRQWFSLARRDPAFVQAGADRAAPVLMAFIEAELAARRLAPDRLALIGFSQGTMMALHVGLAMVPPPAAIIGFSGALVAPDRLTGTTRIAPQILLVHGTADEVVPFSMMASALTGLRQGGLTPHSLARPGLGHGIDEAGISAAAAFLVAALPSV